MRKIKAMGFDDVVDDDNDDEVPFVVKDAKGRKEYPLLCLSERSFLRRTSQ